MNHGYLTEFAKDLQAYISGQAKIPYVAFEPDHNWNQDLVRFENQSIPGLETYNCTGFAATTQIEILEKRLYNIEKNYSDRWVGIIAGTHEGGNDPHIVYEAIRKYGLIPESMLPWDDSIKTLEDYYSFKGGNRDVCYAEGQRWLERYEFKHEWLWDTQPSNFLEIVTSAMQTCPVALSCTAFYFDPATNTYTDNGLKNNHWDLGVNVSDKPNEGVVLFDTYKNNGTNIKILSRNHNIARAKRIWLMRKDHTGLKKEVTLLQAVVDYLKKQLLMKTSLLQVCKDHLGTDASPNDEAPDELGCANTLTVLLKQVYPEVPVMVSTIKLYEYLKNPSNGFKYVSESEIGPETIIISPTASGNGKIPGHCGVFLENKLIASNSSLPPNVGKFIVNFTVDTWKARYRDFGGMPVFYFVKV